MSIEGTEVGGMLKEIMDESVIAMASEMHLPLVAAGSYTEHGRGSLMQILRRNPVERRARASPPSDWVRTFYTFGCSFVFMLATSLRSACSRSIYI
jgi:hypothetical protein